MASRAARFGITMSASLVAVALFGLGFDEPRPVPSLPKALIEDPKPVVDEPKPGFDEPKPGETVRELEARLEKLLEEEQQKLVPMELLPIPDNPPPHEGAMIDFPYVVEPPDFIMLEVLEALPARPISGPRLVREDGTITLGFYGEVYVRGLTLKQIKTKVILHLRKYLNDEVLGLLEPWPGEIPGEDAAPVLPGPGNLDDPPLPDLPRRGEPVRNPFNLDPPPAAPAPDQLHGKEIRRENSHKSGAPVSASTRGRDVPPKQQEALRGSVSDSAHSPARGSKRSRGPNPSAMRGSPQREGAIRRTSEVTLTADEPETPNVSATQPSVREGVSASGASSTSVQLPSNNSVKITIEVSPAPAAPGTPQTTPTLLQPADGGAIRVADNHFSADQLEIVPPADSLRVFVDIDSYNSKHYYILGDVVLPGRYPYTSNETILDAHSFAGGFLSSADPNNVRLVRPARGGAPARVYKIDWKALTEDGDQKANLQIFPGDRIYVGRSAAYKTTATQAAPARQPQRPAAADQKKK